MLRDVMSARKPLIELVLPFLIIGKCISDMLWSIEILDRLILGLSLVILLVALCSNEIRFGIVDVGILLLMLLISISLVRDDGGFELYIKMMSAFILYFIGRLSYAYSESVYTGLKISAAIILVVNLILYAFGMGRQYWGVAYTFSGVYYFKTDLACALGFSLVTFLFLFKSNLIKYVCAAFSIILIVMSNTRAYYFVTACVLAIYVMYRNGRVLSLKLLIKLAACCLLVLVFLSILSQISLFRHLGFIGFSFDSMSDIFNASNTQGRNEIWAILLNRINEKGMLGWLFGVDLTGDIVAINGGEYGSHSLYIGLLYNVGVVGLALFCLIAFQWFESVCCIAHFRPLPAYLITAFGALFLISGISVYVLQYTQSAWIPMLMFGIAVSESRELLEAHDGFGQTSKMIVNG